MVCADCTRHASIVNRIKNSRAMAKSKKPKPIDSVTVENLDVALRMCNIEIHKAILDKIIDIIEVIEDKKESVSMRDITRLQAEWNIAVTPDLCCGIYDHVPEVGGKVANGWCYVPFGITKHRTINLLQT